MHAEYTWAFTSSLICLGGAPLTREEVGGTGDAGDGCSPTPPPVAGEEHSSVLGITFSAVGSEHCRADRQREGERERKRERGRHMKSGGLGKERLPWGGVSEFSMSP